MECRAQAGPPCCGCPQLGQQHGTQLRVLPQEGGQAQPLCGAALGAAPLLAQQPAGESACRDRAESRVRPRPPACPRDWTPKS